jgi:hypothetical protein
VLRRYASALKLARFRVAFNILHPYRPSCFSSSTTVNCSVGRSQESVPYLRPQARRHPDNCLFAHCQHLVWYIRSHNHSDLSDHCRRKSCQVKVSGRNCPPALTSAITPFHRPSTPDSPKNGLHDAGTAIQFSARNNETILYIQ